MTEETGTTTTETTNSTVTIVDLGKSSVLFDNTTQTVFGPLFNGYAGDGIEITGYESAVKFLAWIGEISSSTVAASLASSYESWLGLIMPNGVTDFAFLDNQGIVYTKTPELVPA